MEQIKRSFVNLTIWQKAHKFVLAVYRLSISFPKNELYGVTSQLRRAAVSVSSNIAEGYARFGKKEKQQFYYMSLGSLTESQNLLLVCRDLKYIDKSDFLDLANQTVEIGKLINSYIRSLKEDNLILTSSF